MMTKTEARAYLSRARQGIRDAEQALKDGSLADLQEALVEATGSLGEIQSVVEEHWGGYGGPEGIRGVQ